MEELPDFVKQEYLDFLDALRISGIINMFGASPYLVEDFPELDKETAIKVLIYWMENFDK